MNGTRLIALAAAVAASLPAASPAARIDPGALPSYGGIRFVAEVTAVPTLAGPGVVEVDYRVAYDELLFLRHGGGYRARFEVTVILYDTSGRQAAGDSWLRAVDVATFEETNSRRRSVQEVLSVDASPGTYDLRIRVRSVDTRSSGLIERRIVVPEAVPGTLSLGTITLEHADPSGEGYVVHPARRFGEDDPVARARIPVYADRGTRYTAVVTITTDAGTVMKTFADTLVQSDWRTEIVRDFPVLDLEIAPYVLVVRVVPATGGEEVTGRARFEVVTSPASWGNDFEKMLAQIGYVASMDEVDRLRDAPEEARDRAWREFWKRRDPDPSTDENEYKDEFFRRLGYANANFEGIAEGWQTDMGRIYIQYGEPDDVESQPIGRELNAWEIWYYYRDHVRFTFVDREGYGEFRLVETSGI